MRYGPINDVIDFVRFCLGEFLVGYRNGRARAARRIEMGNYFEGVSPMARQANLIIARKDAELADMKRADWKVAHIKDLEGQLTERRDRIDDLDKELAAKDARIADQKKWISDLEREYGTTTAALRKQLAEFGAGEDTTTMTRKSFAEVLQALADVQAENKAKDARIAELERANADLDVENDQLKMEQGGLCMDRARAEAECKRLLDDFKSSVDTRLNNVLCEMKEGYDDSIVGFNEAWDVMRKAFTNFKARAALNSSPAARDHSQGGEEYGDSR